MKTITLLAGALLLASCAHDRARPPVSTDGPVVEPRPNPDGSQK